MAMITVGGVDLPAPTSYSVSLQDLDSENTTRNEQGRLIRDRVRAGVYKIEAGWMVTKAELKTITDAIKPAKLSVTFFDPTTSTNPTCSMYAGDRQASLKAHTNAAQPNASMWELTVNLVEY